MPINLKFVRHPKRPVLMGKRIAEQEAHKLKVVARCPKCLREFKRFPITQRFCSDDCRKRKNGPVKYG